MIWDILGNVRRKLKENDLITQSEMFFKLSEVLSGKWNPVFDFAVIDESINTVNNAQLSFLNLIVKERFDAIYFAADIHRQILQIKTFGGSSFTI